MAIINNSKYNWYHFNNLLVEALANDYHEDVLLGYLGKDEYEILNESIAWEKNRYKIDNINIKDYLHYLLIESDLQAWSFDWTNCYYQYPIFSQQDYRKNPLIQEPVELDGWSQYEYHRSGQPDKQIYKASDNYLHIFVADVSNGIGLQINLKTYEIRYYAISEDDGHWFITNYFFYINEKNINYWKMLIMSEISELRLNNFDHQRVIEQIWNDNILEKVNKIYRW